MIFLWSYLAWQGFFVVMFFFYMMTMPQYRNLKEWNSHEIKFLLVCSLFWPVSFAIMVFDLWTNRLHYKGIVKKWVSF